MQIVFITPSLKTGGGNRVFIELANRLCAEHEITILYPNNSSERHTFAVDPAVRFEAIGPLGRTKAGKLANVFRTIRYANRNFGTARLIFTDPLFAVFSSWLRGRRTYRFIQADDYRIFDDGALLGNGLLLKTYKFLTLRSYRSKKNRFIFNSRFVYETFLRDAGRRDVPLRLVHPAVDGEVFSSGSREAVPGTRICLVARRHPSKGLASFIDVYRNLPDGYREKTDGVVLISHDDLSGLDTEGMTILRPRSDADMADIYRGTGIFVFPSWREGFGLPPLEAMACGCACLISFCGGVDEFARPDENCLMFEPRDAEGLADGLIRLLENGRLRMRIAREGESTAARFSWDRSVRQLLDILNETDI